MLSWILSVQTARRHFSSVNLHTDSVGARLLVDKLGLCFDAVSTDLDNLKGYDPHWWTVGKLHTYRRQEEPFVHIDSDAFLWNPIAPSVLSGDIIAQNPEYFLVGSSEYYRPHEFEAAIDQSCGGWLPEEWVWCRSVFAAYQKAIACGIFGGNYLQFIRYYVDLAFQMLNHTSNKRRLERISNKAQHAILLEQYLLSTCVEYHRGRSESPFANVMVRYMFDSFEQMFLQANRVGFTHLLAQTKREPATMQRLDNRVARDCPELYERCQRIFRS